MFFKTKLNLFLVAIAMVIGVAAHAQDVPGIEICTAEKTMERRTSCLQSNINFLQSGISKLALESQRKLDAANRQIEALKGVVAGLQKSVDDLRQAQTGKAAPGAATPEVLKPDAAKPDDTAKKDAVKPDMPSGPAPAPAPAAK